MNDAVMFVQCTGSDGNIAEWEMNLKPAEIGGDGAAYLFDKKPDSDNRHWKEQQEIQEYCEAIREEIASKNGTVEQIKNQL